MTGMLTLAELRAAVKAGEIDTVLVCFADMFGRLVGKRFQAAYFIDGAHEETHACNYLLADDDEVASAIRTAEDDETETDAEAESETEAQTEEKPPEDEDEPGDTDT